MYEFLKNLFGTTEDGKEVSLTFGQLAEKINADGKLKIVNLSDGGYVSEEKFKAKETELKGVQQQLTEANATIKSYSDMDIDGIKKSAKDWEEKYNTDTKDLQDKLKAQENEFAVKTYLGNFKFSNDLCRDAIYNKFIEKNLARDGDKFLGADDFMNDMKTQYPTAFVNDEPPTPEQPKPHFTDPNPKPTQPPKKLSLQELMKYKNEHPEATIKYE